MRRVQAAVTGLALVVFLTACPGTVSLTAPSDVTATPELSAININWQDESDNEQGFVVFRAEGEGDFVQVAEVGPNVTSYRDTALEADVVYRYAVAAKGSAQNSAQTVQAEAGVSVSYHGEAVRSFTGEVVDYGAGQAQLVARNFYDLFNFTSLGNGTISAQGEFTFTYNATVASLSSILLCGTGDAGVEGAFSPALFIGDQPEITKGIVLASSQAAAQRALAGPGEMGDVAVVWLYVAENTSYQSGENCLSGGKYNLELKAGWNTVVFTVTGIDPTFNQAVGTVFTAVPPADLNWYFVDLTQFPPPEPPVSFDPTNFFGLSDSRIQKR